MRVKKRKPKREKKRKPKSHLLRMVLFLGILPLLVWGLGFGVEVFAGLAASGLGLRGSGVSGFRCSFQGLMVHAYNSVPTDQRYTDSALWGFRVKDSGLGIR